MNRFIRHDLMCTDPAAGARFYGEVFGWQLTEIQAMGFTLTRLSLGDRVLGAIMPFDAKLGFPSHWMPYIHVADVDACCRRVTELGGDVCEQPMDIPPGRFAVANDPGKGFFSPFLPKEAPAVDAGQVPVGAFCWDELLAVDTTVARGFYEGLLGWTATEMPMGRLGTYTVFSAGAAQVAGMLAMPEDAPARQSMWLPYVRVAGTDATVERAVKLGGQVFVTPKDAPGVGRFAVFGDPTGAKIGVLQSA